MYGACNARQCMACMRENIPNSSSGSWLYTVHIVALFDRESQNVAPLVRCRKKAGLMRACVVAHTLLRLKGIYMSMPGKKGTYMCKNTPFFFPHKRRKWIQFYMYSNWLHKVCKHLVCKKKGTQIFWCLGMIQWLACLKICFFFIVKFIHNPCVKHCLKPKLLR